MAFADKSPVLLGTSHAALKEVVALMEISPGVRIAVEGHSSNRGDAEVLLNQSEAMAKAVFDFLVSQGVTSQRMERSGKGGEDPIATNRTRSGRKQNRRVEIAVIEGSFSLGEAP